MPSRGRGRFRLAASASRGANAKMERFRSTVSIQKSTKRIIFIGLLVFTLPIAAWNFRAYNNFISKKAVKIDPGHREKPGSTPEPKQHDTKAKNEDKEFFSLGKLRTDRRLYRYECPESRTCLKDDNFPELVSNLALVVRHVSEHVEELNTLFPHRCAIAIGFGSGFDDPTWSLYTKMNFTGIAIEGDPNRFNRTMKNIYENVKAGYLSFSPNIITPRNAKKLFRTIPRGCEIFKIDIDGFDCHIMRTLLSEPQPLRPKIVLMEVSENFPPPVQFSVLFHKSYSWNSTAFVGCSLGYAEAMLRAKGYLLLFYHKNNALFVHRSISFLFEGQVPAKSLDMYRLNKPSFRDLLLEIQNDRWTNAFLKPQQKEDSCAIRESILCFLLQQRERAGFAEVPFRYCVPGCPDSTSRCDEFHNQELESAFWPLPEACTNHFH
mmetsp:Transcript_3718/g.8861  ORF Transcript_3718/g.8861 Transcript_3718/m.8861 type:complete len:435 (-) Transcript_3718:148-1452(-)